MEGQLILHVPSKKVTFLNDLDQAIKDYIISYDKEPAAILVRTDSQLPDGETYRDIPIMRRDIIAPNYFWLLWNTRETKKEAIWTRK